MTLIEDSFQSQFMAVDFDELMLVGGGSGSSSSSSSASKPDFLTILKPTLPGTTLRVGYTSPVIKDASNVIMNIKPKVPEGGAVRG